jgi:erythromycin esterase-like protein
MANEDLLLRAITSKAHGFAGTARDFEPLLELTQGANCVLLGEASHGTHEFYHQRARLTKRLITEQHVSAVAVEADWPDAYRVNRYVLGLGSDADAEAALSDFKRFPSWMWRNADVLDFVGWLREHNDSLPPERKVGFYGLDLYSLHSSIDAVLAYLQKVDPAAAKRARDRYACFEHFGADPEQYGYVTSLGLSIDCEQEVVSQLVELQQQRDRAMSRGGLAAGDEYFQAEQNARVVKEAEKYYRALFGGQRSSWNLRDTHMADTLDALRAHLARRSAHPKIVVWAHNSHVGDARATDQAADGQLTLGQLARQRDAARTTLIGFSTYSGTVTAASNWDRPAERKQVRPALPHSYEQLFHRVGMPAFSLCLRDLADTAAVAALEEPRLQRAIGVVYKPDSERQSHYYYVKLAQQFDAIIHFDHTRAVEPLERTARERDDVPETFPTGM